MIHMRDIGARLEDSIVPIRHEEKVARSMVLIIQDLYIWLKSTINLLPIHMEDIGGCLYRPKTMMY